MSKRYEKELACTAFPQGFFTFFSWYQERNWALLLFQNWQNCTWRCNLELWYSLFVIDVILRVLLILFEFESTSLFHEYFINFCTKMVLILWFNDVNMPWKIQFKHLLYSSPCCPMFACTLGIEIIKVLKFRGKWNRLTS